MRHLHQDASAVARVGFAAAGAAVVEVDQDGEGVADDFVGFAAFDVDHKADPAGIVLELRVVKTLFWRPSAGRSAPVAFRTHRLTVVSFITNSAIFYSILPKAQLRS